jgi:dienelactone hydrolase
MSARPLLVLLAALVVPAAAAAQQPAGPLAGLPLSIYRPAGTPRGGALFFSGDGGWHGFDDTNGDSLSAMGYLTLGVNDLRAFAHEISGDSLARLMHTLTGWMREQLPAGTPLYLVGYSFGADIVADALPRGTDTEGAVLLGPGERGIRAITVDGFFFREPTGPTSYDNAERLNARPACLPVVFVNGGDDHSAKGAVVFPRVRQPVAAFTVAGASHHYHGGDARYTAVLRDALAWLAAHRCPT